MSRRRIVMIAGVVGVVFVLAAGWYLVSPLFIDETVDEAFPGEVVGVETAVSEPTAPSDEAVDDLAEPVLNEGKLRDKMVDEDMPAEGRPELLGQGQFVDIDDLHRGSGLAMVFALPDGRRILRVEEFNVTNGPDLHVILSSAAAPTSRDDIGDDYIDLGELKGNMGNQNYDIPEGVDISAYQSVVIYCVPFHVVFSTAAITPP